MFTLSVKGHFDAAHRLPKYQGKCSNLHGHRWEVVAKFKFEDSDLADGMACDFGVLKNVLNNVLNLLDHKFLNEEPWVRDSFVTPTAEELARLIYIEIHARTQTLREVIVYESPDCGVSYVEG